MKLTLQITASASTLSAILASLPPDALVEAPVAPLPVPVPAAGPAPVVAGPVAIPPVAPVAAPISGDDDDNGPAAEGTPDRDSSGLPWDARIHSSGANRINASDGTWRKKRGVDQALVTQVEAELRANAAPVPQQIVPPQPMPMPVMPMQPNPPIPAPAPTAAPQPVVPQPAPIPQPVAPQMPTQQQLQEATNAAMGVQPAPVAAAPQPGTGVDFPTFMAHLGPKFQETDANGTPLLHADYLAAITTEISNAYQLQPPLQALTDIAGQQHLIDYAIQLLQRDSKW